MLEDDLNATPARPSGPAPAGRGGTAATVLRNASTLGIAMIVSRIAGFGLAIVMGRYLGASEYGRYGFAQALSTVLVPLADMGITTYLVRESARAPTETGGALGRLMRSKAAASVVVVLLTGVGSVVLSSDATAVAVVMVVIVAGVADGFTNFVFGYFRGREQMGLEGKLTAAGSLVRSLLGVVLVITTGKLLPALILALAVSIVQLAIALRRLRLAAGAPDTQARRKPVEIHWRTVLSMGSFFLLTMIYTRSDSVLVGSLEGSRAVGLYTAACTLMLGLQILPFVAATAVTPVFARTHDSERALFRSSWDEGTRIVLVISLPLALLVSLVGKPIMQQVFGAEFAAGGTALSIVVWCSPIVAFNTMLTGALRGARRESWLFSTAALGAALNVGVNFWAIPTFGIAGAASTTVATELIVCALLGGLGARHGVLPLPRLPYARLAASLLALGGAVALTRELPLVALGTVALLVYGVVVIATGVVRTSDLNLIRGVLPGARPA